jgi:hypothetical protein
MRLQAARSSSARAPGPATSSFPNDVMSIMPTCRLNARDSSAIVSSSGGLVNPNARWSAPARRQGRPGHR